MRPITYRGAEITGRATQQPIEWKGRLLQPRPGTVGLETLIGFDAERISWLITPLPLLGRLDPRDIGLGLVVGIDEAVRQGLVAVISDAEPEARAKAADASFTHALPGDGAGRPLLIDHPS